MRTYLKLVLTILVSGAFLAATVAACSVPVGLIAGSGEGEPTELELDPLAQRSYVHASDGSVLAGLHDGFNREPVELAEVPEHLLDAIIAVEDQGFWQHDGVDGRGLLRAFSVNVGAGGVSQGGSTLTQQVVKMSLLGNEQSLERKVQELVLARRLEEEFSKEEILTRYINSAYFGNGAYGVEAAAETYFGVSAEDLDIGQSALLAGMIRSPRYNDPVAYPENALQRRSDALSQMEDQGYITADERVWFDASPLPEEVQESAPPPDDYFVDLVREQLLEDERFDDALGTGDDRTQAVFQGGIRVHTTFDPAAQIRAIAARNEVLPGENAVFDAGNGRQGTGAMVSVDPRSGAVRTMVAGPGFQRGVEGEEALGEQYNLVTQNERQIGSTVKPFILTEAMEQDHSPFDQVDGRGPCRFDNPDGEPDPYEATNYGGSRGDIDTLLAQTARSSNCSFIRLALVVGYENVVATSERMGVTGGAIDGNLSSALGSREATPLEMASAYATLANEGVYNEPYFVERIEGPDGRVIYEHEPTPERAVSAESARLVTDVLEHNVQSGTGTNAQVAGHHTAGKTGTTNDNSDVWFVGYTGQLATAAWVGGLEGNFPITINGVQPSSSEHPARMFGLFMNAYHEGRDPVPFVDGPLRPPADELLAPDPSVDLDGVSRFPSRGDDDDGEDEDEDEGRGDRGARGNGGGGGRGTEPEPDPDPEPEPPPDISLPTVPPPTEPPEPEEPPEDDPEDPGPDPDPDPGGGGGGGGGGD